MTFTQAVSSVLGQYAGFHGRARRSEFWWWSLFGLLLGVAVAVAEVSLGIGDEEGGPVSTVLALALLLPNLTVSVRRLHDSSRSGWWLLVVLVPFVGPVALLVLLLAPSTPGWNAHGPDPRGLTDPAVPAAPQTVGALSPPEPLDPPDPVRDGGTGAAWTPPGWDLPSAAEPGAGRPAQDRSGADDPDAERPPT